MEPENVEPVAEPVVVETPVAESTPSLADAIQSGIDSAPERGPAVSEDPVEEGAAKPEGEEGAAAGEGEEKPADEKPAEAGDKPVEEKPADKGEPDHVNDPIPKELSERTRERITSLASMVKEKDATIENQGNLINAVISTGASPDQFAGIITYLRNLNSTNPADLELCLKDMDNMRQNIAMRLGKPVAGVDFVAEHPDLVQKVHYGQLSKEDAQEIAVNRARAKMQTETATRAREAAAAKTASEAEVATGQKELNELGDILSASDPAYKVKYDAIMPALLAELRTTPPSQWRSKFLTAYKGYKAPARAAAPAVPADNGMVRDPQTGRFVPVRHGTPERPGAPGGGGGNVKAAPKSLREAIEAGLSGAG